MKPTIANPQIVIVKAQSILDWAKGPRCRRCRWPKDHTKTNPLCLFCARVTGF